MDIDGVMADITHRLHYQREKDYEKFYSLAELAKDTALYNGCTLVEILSRNHGNVVFVTGRPERTRTATENWLKYYEIECPDVLMRHDGDYRPSDIVKVEAIKTYFENLRQDAKSKLPDELQCGLFIDDDPKNVIAVEKAFPNVTGLLYGTKRLKERD